MLIVFILNNSCRARATLTKAKLLLGSVVEKTWRRAESVLNALWSFVNFRWVRQRLVWLEYRRLLASIWSCRCSCRSRFMWLGRILLLFLAFCHQSGCRTLVLLRVVWRSCSGGRRRRRRWWLQLCNRLLLCFRRWLFHLHLPRLVQILLILLSLFLFFF